MRGKREKAAGRGPESRLTKKEKKTGTGGELLESRWPSTKRTGGCGGNWSQKKNDRLRGISAMWERGALLQFRSKQT